MKVQYRIANINGSYHPQVRTKKFLFWSRWGKIAKHPSGYGVYIPPNTRYPKTKSECEQIIMDFHEWLKNKNTVNESYIKFSL